MKPLHVVLSLPQSLVHTPTLSLVIPSIVDSVPTSSLTSVDPRYWNIENFIQYLQRLGLTSVLILLSQSNFVMLYEAFIIFLLHTGRQFPLYFLWKSIVIHKETDMNSKMTCPKMNKHFPLTLKIVYKCIA